MANDLSNIKIPGNQWVDLYDLTGITVGDQLFIENIGAQDVYLAVQATQPAQNHDAYTVIERSDDGFYANSTGDAGAWAYCHAASGKLRISTSAPNGFIRTLRAALTDGYGKPIGSLRGAIDIHDADVHHQLFNQYVHYNTGNTTTLSSPAAAGDNVITVASVALLAVGNEVEIYTGGTLKQPTIFTILGITGNDLTLDTPLSFAMAAGSTVEHVYTNLVDPGLSAVLAAASVSAPVVFTSDLPTNAVAHLVNMSVVLTDNAAMDFTTFGGRAALPNGVVLRAQSGGVLVSFTNWKQNLDLDNDAFKVAYQSKVGGGEFGLAALYNIRQSTGGVVYLDGSLGDKFEVLVQDDISALTTFKIKMQGHYEGA